MKKQLKKNPETRAAILLEAILALLFITLTVGAVAGLFSKSMAQVRQAQMRTRAMILAENKLAELQAGLVEFTEGKAGDYEGKPENFFWQVDLEPSQIPELQRLTVTITYDDPIDGFEYRIHRLYSPSLNLSAERMKQISTDPVQMQALGGTSSGLQDMISMLGEFPGGDKIVEAFLRGGVPGMLTLFNKLAGGKITAEELLQLMGQEQEGTSSFGSIMASGSGEASVPLAWTDYDTAGIGEKSSTSQPSGLASTETGDKAETGEQTDEETTTTKPSGTGSGTETASTPVKPGSMTREEAIKRMQEMLRRMANKPK
jgi:hypothetical protein